MVRSSLAGVLVLSVAVCASTARVDSDGVTVHEWGTFTSIANADGTAALWVPTEGPQDLPCFVKRSRIFTKGLLDGTVRMETPVLYFYSSRPATISVDVRFRRGAITEWFPDARVAPAEIEPVAYVKPSFESGISWPSVRVTPNAPAKFTTEGLSSHYYAARETDAAPIDVAGAQERFLFYRGVGRFAPPIAATISRDGTIVVRNPSGNALGDIVVFENHGGRIGYQMSKATGVTAAVQSPTPSASLASLQAALKRMLVDQGLFEKEAAAMLATWNDAWFEEGTRIFYIVPAPDVDAILPLTVSPAPAAVARVFVGRLEVFPAARMTEVRDAIATGNLAALKRQGRFLGPILNRIRDELPPYDLKAMEDRLSALYASEPPQTVKGCPAPPRITQ